MNDRRVANDSPSTHDGRWILSSTAWLIQAWCWLRVAASPALIGVLLGGVVYSSMRRSARGAAIGCAITAAGLVLGIVCAERIRRRQQLVEYAHGLDPTGERDPGDREAQSP